MTTGMYFDIDLFGGRKNHFHFRGHGHLLLDYEEVILDPSVLFYLTSHKIMKSQIIYYLPDNLIRLIDRSKKSEKHLLFLESFLTYFGYGYSKQIKENDWKLFYENIQSITIKQISLDDIKSNQQDNYYDNYLKMFANHNFYVSMSPQINFLGDYIAKIMEFSKRTGKIILSKSRKLSNLLRENIISLELPKRFDSTIQAKSNLLNRMFDFQGGRTTKFFIGISLGIGGFFNPVIGASGLIFAFIDP